MTWRRLFPFVSLEELLFRILMDRHSVVGIGEFSWFEKMGGRCCVGLKTGLCGGDEGLLLIHTAFRISVVQKRSYAQIPHKGHALEKR